MEQPIWNFEQEPYEPPCDETDYNLRAYFDRMDDTKMRQYRSDWTDEQIMEWDGNFTSEQTLLVPCCERDIDIEEYRCVIKQAITYRNRCGRHQGPPVTYDVLPPLGRVHETTQEEQASGGADGQGQGLDEVTNGAPARRAECLKRSARNMAYLLSIA